MKKDSNYNDPVFLVGVDRSGTTLLSLLLDSHSRIAIPYESHFFVKYYNNSDLIGDLDHIDGRLNLVNRILSEPYVSAWDVKITEHDIDLNKCLSLEETTREIYCAYARHFDKDIWGDKTPLYTRYIYILNKMFPSCRLVHIIRDGRDVASEIVNKWWGANDYVTAIQYWVDTLSCARKMLRMLPDCRYVELRFEDLVSNPRSEIRRVTDFLGVDFEENMLTDYQLRAAAKVGAKIDRHHSNLLKPISQSHAYRWKKELKPADQAIAFEIAGSLFAELGYPAGIKKHPLKNIHKGYHSVKESFAWRFKRGKGMAI